MTTSATEKNIATAVSLSVVLAFAVTTKSHATTQFPPDHSEASFNERHDVNEAPVAGSYYRPNTGENIVVEIRDGNVELAYSNVRISPYYRAAN